MRPSPWLWSCAGLLLGAGTVALLPPEILFHVPPPPGQADPSSPAGERWACPMMDFIGTRPGACPVCGMDMARVTAGELNREQQRRMGIELVQVTEGPARFTVRAHGVVEYDNRYRSVVIPRVGGRIVLRHPATWGCCEDIAADAPIVDLYSPEAFAAQGELAAARALGDEPAVRALVERFERWHLAEVAEAILAGGAPQDTVTIRAPFAGQVLLRDFERVGERLAVGREVSPGEPLLELVDPNRLTVVARVPEHPARFLREGQPALLVGDDQGEGPGSEAVIDRLGREIDPFTRTREIRLYLNGADGRFPPGALVSARFEAVLTAGLEPADPRDPSTWGRFALVPKSAILSTGVRHVAWRAAERRPDGQRRFELAPVALGPRLEDEFGRDLYVVRAGLQPGDEVAAQGAFLIDSQAQLAGTPSLLFPLGANAGAPAHQP